MGSKNESRYRLPKTVTPQHYDICLIPDLKKFTFEGSEEIHVQIHETTNTIKLNACELSIDRVTIATGDEELTAEGVAISEETKIATIHFQEELPAGTSAVLRLHFQGRLNDKLAGFYRSKYVSPDGESKYAAVTQFAAVDARKCFPCWDEPAVKATFDVTLTVPAGLTALSNMPIKTKLQTGPLTTFTYETSPKMSTYLLAVVIGEFDYVEDKSSDGTLIRVYTPLGKKDQGLFALQVATKVLPYYNQYFKVPYPLPKLDLIAIPDFSYGAMENWGLVAFRETCLLVDPDNTSILNKQSVAITIAHEIAHQWFGNLVTMEWWTHLWLNEGYASFMEFLCVDELFPEYNIWMQFLSSFYTRAQDLDSLRSTHPVEVALENPDELDEIFDDISYKKGASIIRMLHEYIGDEDFRRGMSLYLERHAYANTETEDLWAALAEVSGKPVGEVMSAWTRQAGLPLLEVEDVEHGDGQRCLVVSQRRFLADGTRDEEGVLWPVPVKVQGEKCKVE